MTGFALIWRAALEVQHFLKPEMLGRVPFLAAQIRLKLGSLMYLCLDLSPHGV